MPRGGENVAPPSLSPTATIQFAFYHFRDRAFCHRDVVGHVVGVNALLKHAIRDALKGVAEFFGPNYPVEVFPSLERLTIEYPLPRWVDMLRAVLEV